MLQLDIISDTHFDSWTHGNLSFPLEEFVVPNEGSDICLFAGDAGNGIPWYNRTIEVLEKHYKHVIGVKGNHCYYGGPVNDAGTFWTDLNGIKIAGCPLWTNFRNDFSASMIAKASISDFTKIIGMTPTLMASYHEESKAFLEEHQDADIWLVHFPPFLESNHPDYADFKHLNPYFVNDMGEWFCGLGQRPRLIVHGHSHKKMDYTIADCRVVTNPIGYRGEEQSEHHFAPKMIKFEPKNA